MGIFKRKERSLGVSKKKRDYDLPLNKGSGGQFLSILIALMTFLAILALSASFTLSEMTSRWVSGLENKASVEIPAEDTSGNLIKTQDLDALTDRIYNYLRTHPAVESAEVMSEAEISDLISPWLGNDMEYSSIPLPNIITIHFKKNVRFDMGNLETNIMDIAPQARLDTHESWLSDVLKFTGALNFAALLITLVIGVTTLVAVGGAVQSRMAIYKEELELLHLMGASDDYISKQLQRYVFLVSLKGAAIGAVVGGLTLLVIGWLAGKMEISLLPDFSLSLTQIIMLMALAPIIAFLGMMTARHTVLRALSLMP